MEFGKSGQVVCYMLDDREYHMMNYAYWYFKDEMDDAWMDSDDEGWHDEAWRQQQEMANEQAWREQEEWIMHQQEQQTLEYTVYS